MVKVKINMCLLVIMISGFYTMKPSDDFEKQEFLETFNLGSQSSFQVQPHLSDDYVLAFKNGTTRGRTGGRDWIEFDDKSRIYREVAGAAGSIGSGSGCKDLLTSRQPTCLESLYFSCCGCFFNK